MHPTFLGALIGVIIGLLFLGLIMIHEDLQDIYVMLQNIYANQR